LQRSENVGLSIKDGEVYYGLWANLQKVTNSIRIRFFRMCIECGLCGSLSDLVLQIIRSLRISSVVPCLCL